METKPERELPTVAKAAIVVLALVVCAWAGAGFVSELVGSWR